ncbi:MAG: PEP-CTERM sorting domain-containing protein [Terrimicrobiaceae bacterium]|nr:PEP-CTERM sorting domain-containing protein [Terrimicrobiaceae bacterium]
MKKHNFLATALLAIAGVGLMASPARALTYNPGDLFIGFYDASGTEDYLINIGPAAQYRDAAPGTSFQLNIGSTGADLIATFGADWNARPAIDVQLQWGVFGGVYNTDVGSDLEGTLYASKAASATPLGFARKNLSNQAGAASFIDTMGNSFASLNYTATVNSTVAARQTASNAQSYAFYQAGGGGGSSFSYFVGAQGNFGSGVAGASLDLFRMPIGSGPGTYEGTFSIDSGGTITFTAVPEPSTVAFVGVAAAALAIIFRRRALKNS